MGKMIEPKSASGMYACDCGKVEAHVHGTEKKPCSKCGATDKWTLMVSTDELQKSLECMYLYVCTKNLAEEIASRYEKR